MKAFQERLDTVKRFAEAELRPRAGEFEVKEEIPRSFLQRLGEQGVWGATFPAEYGGLALDPVDYGHLTEIIGKACNSVRELLTVHVSLVGESIKRWGTEEQKRRWLPKMATGETLAAFALTEPEVGSDAKAVHTSYKQKGNRFILNGRKKWISFANIADLILVIAAKGSELTAFLIEPSMPGVSITKMSGLLASNSSHLAEIHMKDVEVPDENVLGRVGGGFAYVVNTALDHGRYSIAWAGVAIAQEALEAMVTYSRTRKQGGKYICEYDGVQRMIAESSVNLRAARSLCLTAGRKRRDKHPEAMAETMMAKYFSSKMAMKVATDAVQVFGANGFSRKYPVERLFREAKVLEIIEGTSQVLQPLIAQHTLRTGYRDEGVITK
ncbi:acyl-CoA dehydrogenase [Kroppenstedtia guangzhouensis]|uniref:Acyl-CoA dehydrogenase n=1 Tax=Kroppenstedtia guangzhouensis TaxID=1274356 RepID=A0ABQ1G640_9BACL|nr:acyl-CoA dehydrogenase family protein [Kroppenstedtia guangzhouensis]GGA37490.1 acyl-CoA dehydrogenase [Kroppenstedtia guangzhouensis]